MTATLNRAFAAIDLLAERPGGASVQEVATTLDLPPSATHRLLGDLVRLGVAQQDPRDSRYGLTLRLATLGLAWLGRTGIPDLAQPVLDHLAQASGELVRLSVAAEDALVWIAVAQGATSGLRYDPAREQGAAASLAYSASGRAWAASLPEDRALSLIAAQGLEPPTGAREGSRLSLPEVIAELDRTRDRGHAEAEHCFLDGMAAIAVPVPASGPGTACLSIAGPSVRLTPARRAALLPSLHAAAKTLASLAPASALLRGRT